MKARVIITAIIFFASYALFAQPGNPNTDPDVPITGIEILVALGGLLGMKKFLNRKKPN